MFTHADIAAIWLTLKLATVTTGLLPLIGTPISQDAVILSSGKGNAAAEALAKYLKGDKAKAIIRAYGYDI